MSKKSNLISKACESLDNISASLIKWLLNKIWIFTASIKKGDIRNVLNLNSLLKLIFLYAVTVSCIIFFYFDFSPGAFKKTSTRKLAIYSVEGRIGEHQSYLRTIRALKKLGWEYVGVSFTEHMINYRLTRHFYIVATYIVNKFVGPEVNIALTHYVTIVPTGYNLVYLNVPDYMLYSLKGKFSGDFPHLQNYDGYIDLYSVYNIENPLLKRVLHYYGNDDAPIIPAYLAQNQEKYIEPESYDKIVITGSLWGCNRGSYRVKDALNELGKEDLLIAYGLDYAMDYLGDAYKGTADKYGVATDTLIELQRKGGIALAIHNFEHLIQAMPTSRLTEAVTSGAVLISDDHPFIRKFFGDNVLYFDSFKNTQEIFEEIKSHALWIKSHPKEARAMAKKANEIFVKDWSLEVQLQKVMDHVDRVRKAD